MTQAVSHNRSVLLDRSFIGMVLTQFLGAFNDNVFKQIILFICVGLAVDDRTKNLQGAATIAFSVPFILLSGYCGYLSDKVSKRSIIVLSKLLEILVMVLGMGAFLSGSVNVMLGVLFLMGAQSALFGPSKYGILPELFEMKDLPRVNGWVLMTTFLAIILGFTAAGYIKESLSDERLWTASFFCIGIAMLGTLTSLLIRPTPVARPEMTFHLSALAVSRETQLMLWENKRVLWVLLATSIFWTVGGVVYPNATNDLGMLQLKLGEASTGKLAACTGVGIAVGCFVAGALSRQQFDARLIRWGGRGMLLGMILLALPGSSSDTNLLGVAGSAAALVWLGFCAGLFTVPLTSYLQARTPRNQKGRIIGAMNLANWIGLAMSGVYYSVWNLILAGAQIPPNAMYGAAALLLLPLVLFYHPRTESFAEPPSDAPEG